jgi:hypothetical protein
MPRAEPSSLLAAALLRPINLLAPGVGLLLALVGGLWWLFPLSFVPYALMVILSLRDPSFVARAVRREPATESGEPIAWKTVARELGAGSWVPSLERIARAENNLGGELQLAPEGARAAMASTLGQVRSAASMGIDLARRLRSLEYALQGYGGMNPAQSRAEAQEKRSRASESADEAVRRALLDAASALEQSAQTAESLRALRERTLAQLESLAATLESVAVRSVRLRVSGDGGPDDISASLQADVAAMRETLDVLESVETSSVLPGASVGEKS